MTRHVAAAIFRYSVAIGAIAMVVGLNFALGLREHFSSALFLAAVAASSWYGGLGPGLVATVLGAISLDYFFIGEYYALDLGGATWLWLAVFVAVAVFLNLLQESQRRMTTALREQDHRKTRFMAVLAHELRNFLSPLSSAVGVLQLHGSDHKLTTEMCGIIDRQVQNMTALINDLLDAARIAQGKFKLNLEAVEMRQVVTEAVESVQPLLDERGHYLETTFDEAPLVVRGDRIRLAQVLVNLLNNAAKYTGPGGRISITVRRESDAVLLRVRDSGKGISEKLLPTIFDLFIQAEPGAQGGLGIGLNLVRGLVEMHGGSIVAFSEGSGAGSEFVVRLPAAGGVLVEPATQATSSLKELADSHA